MIKIQGILSKIVTMSDRTIRLFLDLNEVPPEVAGELFNHLQNYVNIGIAPNDVEIKPEDIDLPPVKADSKQLTPSQQLRNVFYQIYSSNNQGFTEFDAFYKAKMNELIKHYKSKLNEIKI